MGDLLSIIEFLFVDNSYYLFGIILLIVFFRLWMYSSLISGDYEKHRLVFHDVEALVREQHWGQRYLIILSKLIRVSCNLIGDRRFFYAWDRDATLYKSFTRESYDFCIRLSVLYPLVSFLILLVAHNGELGLDKKLVDFSLILNGDFLTLIFCFFVGGILIVLAMSYKVEMSTVLLLLIIIILFLAITLFFLVSLDFFVPISVAWACIFTLFLIAKLKVTGYFVFQVFSFLSGTFILIFLFEDYSSLSFYGVMFLIIFAYLVYKNDHVLEKFLIKSEEKIVLLALWTLLVSTLAISLISHKVESTMLILVMLLPLVNSFVDWVSLGVTRWLIHCLVVGKHSWRSSLIWAGVDVLFALLLLFSLSALIILAVSLINIISGVLVVDLNNIFNSIARGEHFENAWIYVMLLSTLIPTVIHFSVAGGAMSLIISSKRRERMLVDLDNHSIRQKEVFLYVVFIPIIGYVVAPLLLLLFLFFLVSNHGANLGGYLLNFSRYWASILDDRVIFPINSAVPLSL